MIKTLLIVIGLFILSIIILILIIKAKDKKIKYCNQINKELKIQYSELQKNYSILREEKEIETKQKNELAKKLADIACMSIDDVMQQLQK